MKKCVVIYNPASGRDKHNKSVQPLYDILRKYDYDTELIYTKKKNDGTRIIERLNDDVDLVISAGGDGTLHEVVVGNLKRKKRLTIANLPLGTTNDVGAMYGLTGNSLKNLELILKGVKKKIDVCYINDTPFVYVACLGDYIDMAYNTPRRLKKRLGKIAYIIYGLKQLKNKIHSYNVKYTVDGKTYEGDYSFFFITNASRVAGLNDVYYDVKLDDNMFEVALCKVKTKAEMVKNFILLNNMDAKDVPGVTYFRTNSIEIEFAKKPKVSWCIDGEEYPITTNKFVFRVNQDTTMLLPKENIVKLFEEQGEK